MLFYETLGYIKKKSSRGRKTLITRRGKKAHEAEGKKRIYPTFPPTALYVNRFLYIKGRERKKEKVYRTARKLLVYKVSKGYLIPLAVWE